MTAPTDDRKSASVAADSGAYGQPEPGAYPPPPEANRGHGLTIGSAVCSVAAFLIPLVGLLGIVLGFVGHGRGERYGKWAGILAIVCTVAGFALNYVILKNMRS